MQQFPVLDVLVDSKVCIVGQQVFTCYSKRTCEMTVFSVSTVYYVCIPELLYSLASL
jgi:hypothetical protein